MLDPSPFKTGDKVRLKTGKSPIQVLEVDYFDGTGRLRWKKRDWNSNKRPPVGWYIRFMYMSSMSYHYNNSSKHRSWREADDFVFYDPQQENIPMTQSLYQTLEEKPRFGTFLTKNSQGKMVLEMKGRDGEVEAFDPKELEEVLPHTISIRRYQGGENEGETRHYQFAKGVLQKDDVLIHLSTGALYKVTGVDTKSKSARVSKNGFFKLEGSFVQTEK